MYEAWSRKLRALWEQPVTWLVLLLVLFSVQWFWFPIYVVVLFGQGVVLLQL